MSGILVAVLAAAVVVFFVLGQNKPTPQPPVVAVNPTPPGAPPGAPGAMPPTVSGPVGVAHPGVAPPGVHPTGALPSRPAGVSGTTGPHPLPSTGAHPTGTMPTHPMGASGVTGTHPLPPGAHPIPTAGPSGARPISPTGMHPAGTMPPRPVGMSGPAGTRTNTAGRPTPGKPSPTTLTGRPAGVTPNRTVGMPKSGMPGTPGKPGAAVAAGGPSDLLPKPVAPTALVQPTLIASLPDPFIGGPPPKPKPKPPPPPPPEVRVVAVPPIFATPNGLRIRRTSGSTPSRNIEPPVGRHAGWIYNSNGQVIAIFEDNDGIAKAVRVGDEVEGMTVKTIAPDFIVMVDQDGKEHKLKLQGLDTYPGKSKGKDVEATPAMPAWGQ